VSWLALEDNMSLVSEGQKDNIIKPEGVLGSPGGQYVYDKRRTGGQLSNLKVSWVALEDNMYILREGLKDNYQT